MNLEAFGRWHQTKKGLLTFTVVELVAAYGAISWAIDSGRLLLYFATIVLLIGGIQNLVKLVKVSIHGNHKQKARKAR